AEERGGMDRAAAARVAAVGVGRALDARSVDAVLGRLRAGRAILAARAEAGGEVDPVGGVEDRRRVLGDERGSDGRSSATDVEAAQAEVGELRADGVGIELTGERRGGGGGGGGGGGPRRRGGQGLGQRGGRGGGGGGAR